MARAKFPGSVVLRKEADGRQVIDILGIPAHNPPVPTKGRADVLLVGATEGFELTASPIGELAITAGITVLREVYQAAVAAKTSPKPKTKTKGNRAELLALIEQLLAE